jgi:hypothetical protein
MKGIITDVQQVGSNFIPLQMFVILIWSSCFIGIGLNIYLSSIAKQVLATYINHFLVSFLEPTSTGAIWRIIWEA